MDAREFCRDDCLVQSNLNRLVRGESRAQIRPRPMDMLCFRAQRQGEVVSNDEIIAAVGPKPYMAGSGLGRSIAEVRAIPGDDAAEPRYVETIVQRGYRPLAPVPRGGLCLSAPRRGQEVRAAPKALSSPEEHTCSLCWGERKIPLAQEEDIVGRAGEATVQLESAQVSRRHARIVVSGGRAVLKGLASKNGTYVRGQVVQTPVVSPTATRSSAGAISRCCAPANRRRQRRPASHLEPRDRRAAPS